MKIKLGLTRTGPQLIRLSIIEINHPTDRLIWATCANKPLPLLNERFTDSNTTTMPNLSACAAKQICLIVVLSQSDIDCDVPGTSLPAPSLANSGIAQEGTHGFVERFLIARTRVERFVYRAGWDSCSGVGGLLLLTA
jgi:hypothetical protein